MALFYYPVVFSLAILTLHSRGMGQASLCSDDFSEPGIGSGKRWTFIDKDGSPGGSAEISGGALQITGKGADIFKERNFFVGVYRMDIKGDFDVSVKIISQDSTHPWAQAGILAANNAEDLTQGGYTVLDISPANGYNHFYDALSAQGELDSRKQVKGIMQYPAWLRLKKSGGKFHSWYKQSEAGEWKTVAEDITSRATGEDSHIALFSVSHNVDMDGKTVFDDFECLHEPASAILLQRSSPNRKPMQGVEGAPRDVNGRFIESRAFPPTGVFLRGTTKEQP